VNHQLEGFAMFTIAESTGFVASTLVLMTFVMSDMRMLRTVALSSNIAFIAYGVLDHLMPVLSLHVLLLPINVLRLVQMERIRRGRNGKYPVDVVRSTSLRN
jgi:hypothetical protein